MSKEKPIIVIKKLHEIKPYARNPRVNNKTVDELCKVIPIIGFNVPLVVDEDGIIIKGHARFKAAIRLGLAEVPCIISHEDHEINKLDRIADNRVQEFSEWDEKSLFEEIDKSKFEVGKMFGLTNVTDESTEDHLSGEDSNLGDDSSEGGEFVELFAKCVCHNCGKTFFVSRDEVEDAE